MFAWLLTKPKLVIDLVIGSLIIIIVAYGWYAHNQINNLKEKINIENLQDQQNKIMISDLNNRLVLLQKLNDKFNASIQSIQQNQQNYKNEIASFDLKSKTKKDPKQAELFINTRNHKIINELNNLGKNSNEIKK